MKQVVKNTRIPVIIYILMAYTILQFFWWTYLIFELHAEIISLEQQLLSLAPGTDVANQIALKGNLDQVLYHKKMMILGEGGVFLLILLTGFYLINRSRKKEAALARQESNFMLSITHELNTPLAGIQLSVETLKRPEINPEQRQQLLLRTGEETKRLQQLVNNILTASRMEATGFALHREEIELKPHLENYIKKFDTICCQEIRLHVAEGIGFVSIDAGVLETILGNLLENAAKYSPDDSTIELEVSVPVNNQLEIKVADRGVGIAEEERKRVFEKFYRVGNEETRRSKGTGLGLYIVQYLIKALDGSIRILSNPLGGTIFKVTIPI